MTAIIYAETAADWLDKGRLTIKRSPRSPGVTRRRLVYARSNFKRSTRTLDFTETTRTLASDPIWDMINERLMAVS